jgi:hypothetical protein
MIIKSNFISSEIFDRFLLNDPILNDKPISIFSDYIPVIEELQINPYNILILNEPNELFGFHSWAFNNHHCFSCILTWNKYLLDNCNNALLFPFGMSFFEDDRYVELSSINKEFEISFMCGNKQMIEGHHLRHKIYNKQPEITIPTKWFYTTDQHKSICFENSMFHLAVENSQHENFFTEKIIDAFLTKTIPVYWGCPNIEDFFDVKGMYIFENENEAINVINSLTEEDYLNKKEAIEYNYQIANYWKDYYIRLISILKEIIKLNNI